MPVYSAMLVLLAAGPGPAAPIAFPAPQHLQVGGCVQVACTSAGEVRVCKCIPEDRHIQPGITVDRGENHLEWDTRLVGTEVADFLVLSVDLSGDGKPELVIASRSAEASPQLDRTWDLTIVDGGRERFTSAETHDFGPDAIGASSLLLTEWEPSPKGLVFVGREYTYADGRLEPARAPVLRRALSDAFGKEREAAAKADALTLTPRRFLADGATQKGRDEPPKGLSVAMVLGVSRDDGVLALHLELENGALKMLSVEPVAALPLRLASAKQSVWYPLRYSPADAEAWLSVRSVRVSLENEHLVGPVWLETPVPANQGAPKAHK